MTPDDRTATIGDLKGMEARLIETMRDMQTEILRGFAAYSGSQDIRLRKLEVDHSNLDSSVSGRMLILEQRLREIEKRLRITYLPEPPVS